MGRNGVVTTSDPLAAQAGLEILQKGGNAIDAAVATAAVLNVVEPESTGLGGDMFAIVYSAKDRRLHVLNSSGMAATGQTLAFMNSHGYKFDPRKDGPGSGMPNGVLAVTVPGAAWGWQEMLDKFGTMRFDRVLDRAARYAEEGFPVAERHSADWRIPKGVNADRTQLDGCCTEIDPDSIKTFYIDGRGPRTGQIFRNPDLAKTLRILQKQGRDGFYKGPLASALIDKLRSLGGTMTLEDMARYKGEWVQPIVSQYRGYSLAELPPPSQGFAANEMLNILEACTSKVYPGQTLASLGPRDPRYWHMLIEAKTLAYADLNRFNGDPNFNPGMAEKVKSLTSVAYAETLCSGIRPDKAASYQPGPSANIGDTIVLSTADRWGNMVSWVSSNTIIFGSGITVPGYGFVLHNRGGQFTLDPNSPNVIAPGKRPYTTLAAAFVSAKPDLSGQKMALLLMGADMQSQGHAQIMVNMVDLGANIQAASDMARFHHFQVGGKIELESEAFKLVGPQLRAMGHDVVSSNGGTMGGYQAILMTPDDKQAEPDPKGGSQRPVNGVYRAGTDHRKDGISVAW